MTVTDATLAEDLARAAGQVLMTIRASGAFTGRALGTVGDACANQLLVRGLSLHRPDDAVLSEESPADPARLDRRRVWIVDPLDGTREYSEGREDWAVHVALTIDGRPGPAAVAIPARDRVFSSDPRWASENLGAAPEATPRESGREPGRSGGQLRIAVSRSRPPAQAESVAGALGAELVPIGSAGFKAIAVLTGEVDAYVHAGGQYEWDSAAPTGVALAAGLHASRIDGSPLRYNRPDPLLPDLLICRRELADALLTALARAGSEAE